MIEYLSVYKFTKRGLDLARGLMYGTPNEVGNHSHL